MSYNHLTINERACIEVFIKNNITIREIAKKLGRSPSTISRELKRNSQNNSYNPIKAQEKYDNKRVNCHRKVKITKEIKKYIEDKIALTWSPEQISKRKRKISKSSDFPCFATIYRWIHNKYIDKVDMKKLRRKGEYKRPAEKRGKFNIGKTIAKRPKHIYKRKELGHWEADTVESGRVNNIPKSSYCFVTLAERKSRLYLAKLLPDRKAETVKKAIIELLSPFPKEMRKTITCDRGKEFARYDDIEKELECDVYFTDPYCAWQKGTNENSNGLLREFYPKGMNLSQTTNEELKEKLALMNNRPRKCIGFKTPLEVIGKFKKCCT
jgi:IS30 family transposase